MDAENIIKWGFIGCGEATEKRFLPAFAELAHTRVTAVMGRSPEKTGTGTPTRRTS